MNVLCYYATAWHNAITCEEGFTQSVLCPFWTWSCIDVCQPLIAIFYQWASRIAIGRTLDVAVLLKLWSTEGKAIGRETRSTSIAFVLIFFVKVIYPWRVVVGIIAIIPIPFIIVEFAVEIRLGKQLDGANLDWFGKLDEQIAIRTLLILMYSCVTESFQVVV